MTFSIIYNNCFGLVYRGASPLGWIRAKWVHPLRNHNGVEGLGVYELHTVWGTLNSGDSRRAGTAFYLTFTCSSVVGAVEHPWIPLQDWSTHSSRSGSVGSWQLLAASFSEYCSGLKGATFPGGSPYPITTQSRVIKNCPPCFRSGQCFRATVSPEFPVGLAVLKFSYPILFSVLPTSIDPKSLPQ